MGDTNRTQLFSMKESSWGVIPTAALARVRTTGDNIGYNLDGQASNEIRDDRQVTDYSVMGGEVAGSYNFELSYGTHDAHIISALQANAWTDVDFSGTDISAAASDNSINSSSTDFTTKSMEIGQWILLGGFTGGPASNNTYGKVVSIAANKVVLSGVTLVDASAGDTVTVKGSTITNGTTRDSYIFERYFADIAKYMAFTGNVPNVLNLNFVSRQFVTGSLSFVGKEGLVISGTSVGTGAPTAASTTRVMSAKKLSVIREGGSVIPGVGALDYAKEIALTVNNNIAGKDGLGAVGNINVRSGEASISGRVQQHFESADIYDKYVQDTESSLMWKVDDPDNPLNCYIFSLDRIKYGSGEVAIGGKNQDVLINANFMALMDSASGKTIRIDKFSAA